MVAEVERTTVLEVNGHQPVGFVELVALEDAEVQIVLVSQEAREQMATLELGSLMEICVSHYLEVFVEKLQVML